MQHHNPNAAANVLIRRGIEERKPLIHIEIQILLYFWHGWTLAIHDRPLHWGEWQAWQYGPVMPEVFYQLNYGKGRPIDDLILTQEEYFTEDEKDILDTVYDYRKLGSFTLTGCTQSKNGPWDRIWHGGQTSDNIIDNEILQLYFKNILHQQETQDADFKFDFKLKLW